jgi:6-phosphogluconolactonase (cycloisomerase 2 family)
VTGIDIVSKRDTPMGHIKTRRRTAAKDFMALEPRWMFDGAAVADAAHAAPDAAAKALIPAAPAPVEVRAADPAQNGGKKEVVFVDTSVSDYKTLEAAIKPGIEIEEIDGTKSGLAQIAKWAETHTGYDSISILSHGAEASLQVGTDTVTDARLSDATVQAELAEIGHSLKSGGDLALYGCDVAKGDDGQRFITDLAAATGADVAASTDATGATARGGDWVLERTTGDITARTIDAGDWDHVLGRSSEPTGLNEIDSRVASDDSGVNCEIRSIAISPDGHNLYAADRDSNGVLIYSRNTSTGELTYVGRYAEGSSDNVTEARVVFVSPDGKNVYVGSQIGGENLAVFSRDSATGALTYLQAVAPATEVQITDMAFSSDGAYVFICNRGGSGGLFVFSRASDGQLTALAVDAVGTTYLNTDWWSTIAVSPDDKFVYVTGLTSGTDNFAGVEVYAFDPDGTGNGGNSNQANTVLNPVQGVRPAGNIDFKFGSIVVTEGYAYVSGKSGSGNTDDSIMVYTRDQTTGELTGSPTVVTLDASIGETGGRTLAMTSDKAYLYASSASGQVNVYAVGADGSLSLVSSATNGGADIVNGNDYPTQIFKLSPDNGFAYSVRADTIIGYEVGTSGGGGGGINWGNLFTFGGDATSQDVNDTTTLRPLSTVTITDTGTGSAGFVVVVAYDSTRGDFGVPSGWSTTIPGAYLSSMGATLSSGVDVGLMGMFASLTDAQAAVQALVYTPVAHLDAGGTSATTPIDVIVAGAGSLVGSIDHGNSVEIAYSAGPPPEFQSLVVTALQNVGTGVASGADSVNSAYQLSAFTVTPAGVTYVAYSVFNTTSFDYDTKVVSWNGSAWVDAGARLLHYGQGLSMTTGRDGAVYLMAEDMANGGKAVVMKYTTQGGWTQVGPADFSDSQAQATSIAVDADGKVYAAYSDQSGFSVKLFDPEDAGAGWVTLFNDNNGSPQGTVAVSPVTGQPIIAYSSNAMGAPSYVVVKSYDGSLWSDVGDTNFSGTNAGSVTLTVAGDGSIYVADQEGNDYAPTVWTQVDGTWTQLGILPGQYVAATIAAFDNGAVYASYIDNSQAAGGAGTVVRWDGTSWVTVGQFGKADSMGGGRVGLALTASGELMAGLSDYTLNSGQGGFRVVTGLTTYDAATVASGQTTVQRANAADGAHHTMTYTITGGADAAQFSIVGNALVFNTAPSYGTNADANHDGVFEVEVRADNGIGQTTTELVKIHVTAPPPGPSVSSIDRDSSTAATSNDGTYWFDVTFSQAVTGVTADNFTLTGTHGGGTIDDVYSGDGGVTWWVSVKNVTSDGTLGLDLSDVSNIVSVSSGAALAATHTGDETVTIDTTAPAITGVTLDHTTYVVGDTATATITTAAAYDGNGAYTLRVGGTIDGYTVGNLTQLDATHWTVQFTVTDGGTNVFSGNAATHLSLEDQLGNQGVWFNSGVSTTTTIEASAITLTPGGGSPLYSIFASAQAVDSGITITNPQAYYDAYGTTQLDGGTLTVAITTHADATHDRLQIDAYSGFTITGSALTYYGAQIGTIDSTDNGSVGHSLVIHLAADATPDLVQSLMAAIQFSSPLTQSSADRTIRFTLTDARGLSAHADETMRVQGYPLVSYSDYLQLTGGDVPQLPTAPGTTLDISRDLGVYDAGSHTETWSQGSAPSHGTLDINGGGSGGTYSRANGVYLGIWTATPVTNSITYTPTAGYTGLDHFTIAISNGTNTTLQTVDVVVDTMPTITAGSGAAATFSSSAVTIDSGITITDPDNPAMAGGLGSATTSDSNSLLLVSIDSGNDSLHDVLSVGAVGTITVTGTTVKDGATIIGTIDASGTGSGGDMLMIHLAAGVTASQVTDLAQAIQFSAAGTSSSTDRHITFSVADGLGQVMGVASAGEIVHVTALPAVASIDRHTGASQLTNASSQQFDVTFNQAMSGVSASIFSVAGTDGTGTVSAVTDSGDHIHYTVTVSGISGNGTLRLDQTSTSGVTAVTGGAALSGSHTGDQTYTIDRSGPQISAIALSGTSFQVGDIVTATITTDANDGHGTYTLGAGSTIDGYALSNLTQIDATHWTAQFTVTDGGTSVGAGGTIATSVQLVDGLSNTSATYATPINGVTIKASTNSAPGLTDPTPKPLSVTSDGNGVDLKPFLHVNDSDGGQTETWSQGSAPAHGSLVITGAAAQSGSTDITPGGTITYIPTAGYSGTDSFTIQVSDGQGGVISKSFTVTVSAPPPPPSAPPPPAPTPVTTPTLGPTPGPSSGAGDPNTGVTVIRDNGPGSTSFSLTAPSVPSTTTGGSGETGTVSGVGTGSGTGGGLTTPGAVIGGGDARGSGTGTQAVAAPGSIQAPAVVTFAASGQLTASSSDGAFRVPVIASGQRSGSGDGLIAVRPVAQVQETAAGTISFALPVDTFAHTRPDAVVTLKAAQPDGQPLPPWLAFDPKTGAFTGQPPSGEGGVLTVQVVARDQNGREAVATVRINLGNPAGTVEKPAGGNSAERPADAGPSRTGALRDGTPHKLGRPAAAKLAGHPGFAQQLRLAARHGALRFG